MIARNAMWNLAGFGVPLVVAVACIPPLIDILGPSRFGLLTLLWAVMSYFGVFDMGLGRALTQQMSRAIGSGREHEAGGVASDGLLLLAVLGVAAGIALHVTAPSGIRWLGLDGEAAEALAAARALAWAMPFVLLTSGLRGLMEARGVFAMINVVRLVAGVATVIAPLLVVRLGPNDLAVVAWVLVAVRVAGCGVYAACVARLVPGALQPRRVDRARLAPLLRTGGWMTVTNIIGPLMGYIDRFVVGAVVSMTAVAWYVTPQEIASRLLVVPTALASVLFPKLSEIHARTGERMAAWRLERLALATMFLGLMPVTLALGVGAQPLLDAWVGTEFATQGATAMLIMCAGVLVNALAHVPFAAIQARGDARATAILQLAELPFFVLAVWWFTAWWGVTGTALAWSLRMLVDFAALRAMARPRGELPGRRSGDAAAALVGLLTFAAFAVPALVPTHWGRALGLSIGAVAWLGAVYRLRGEWPALVAARRADGLQR